MDAAERVGCIGWSLVRPLSFEFGGAVSICVCVLIQDRTLRIKRRD